MASLTGEKVTSTILAELFFGGEPAERSHVAPASVLSCGAASRELTQCWINCLRTGVRTTWLKHPAGSTVGLQSEEADAEWSLAVADVAQY